MSMQEFNRAKALMARSLFGGWPYISASNAHVSAYRFPTFADLEKLHSADEKIADCGDAIH